MIRDLSPGKSFADVGGMWNIDGEMAFRAEEAGAGPVALVDAMPATPEFEAERRRRNSQVAFHRGDLHDRAFVEGIGSFEVVWCTGVLYHSPNPVQLLTHLRAMTEKTLVFGTQIIPEIPGVENACVFYPGLSAGARDALAWPHADAAKGMVGIGTPFDPKPENLYANWWWGVTPSALRGMLEATGFKLESELTPQPFSVDVVATVL